MSAPKAGLAAMAALLLAGCSIGPNYVKPPTATPVAYKETAPTGGADTWKPAQPSDTALRADWWTMFNDPQLDALEKRVSDANQDLKAAEARFREARALIGVSRSAEFPTIGVAPSIDTVRDSANRPYLSKTRTLGDFQLPIDASYEIDLWGRIGRGVTAAREESQATAADLQTVSLSIHAELAVDYLELRSADRQKQLLDNTVKAYAGALELTQNRANGGGAPESDVAQAQTQLDTARVLDTDISVQRAQYEHAVAVLVGEPPAAFSIASSPLDSEPPVIPVGLPSELLQRRPDIAAAERRMAEANERIGIAQSAYYPSISLGGASGFEGTNITNWLNWPSFFWAIGTSMSETLFDGGKRDALTEAARADYDTMVADYRQTTLSAFQQVEDNVAALRILDSEERQQNAAVASAQNALKLFTDRYVGGADTYLQVITAQTALLGNERNLVDILRRRNEATVLLVKALGGGWTDAQLPTDVEAIAASANK
jgi:NodT family efflux transporter outer membrane factor (OMF) lipoprotein